MPPSPNASSPNALSPNALAEEFKTTFDTVPSKPDWLDEKIYGEIEKVFPALAKRTSAILSERQKKQFTGHNQIAYRKHEYEKNPLVTTYPLKVWQDAQEIVDSQGFDWNRLKYWVDLWGKCVWCSVNEWRDYNNVQYGPIVNIEFDGYGISKEQYEETKKQIEEFLKTELKDIQAGPGRYTAIRGFLFDLLCARFGVDIVGHTFDGWVALKNPRAIRKISLANRNPYAAAPIDKSAAKPATGLSGGKRLGDGSVSSGTKKPSAAALASAVTPPAGASVSPGGTSPGAVDVIAPRVVTYSDKNHGYSLQERRLTQAELLSGITPGSISWTANPSQDLIERNREIILEIAQNNAVAEGLELSAKSIREVTEEPLTFAIEELVRNAFDAYARVNTGPKSVDGPVRLRISKDNDNVIIEISDNGIGFSRIVNEYDWLDVESNPAGTEHVLLQGGRQIGLRWAKVLAQLHGGKLEILSPGTDGFGTTIRIVVPESAIKINISDGELAMSAETVAESVPLAGPEEMPETEDNFENNLRMGGQLAKTLLEEGVKPEEAGIIIDEYFNAYIGSTTHAASMVKSLQGLLDIGLPSGIAKFFGSRNIWGKAQQGLILQAAKGHLSSSQQTVFQANPYTISVALLLTIKWLGITNPIFVGQGMNLILMTAAVLAATVVVAWGVIRLAQGILHWRETRNNAQTAEIMEAEKAMAEAQAEAIALRQAEEILASREALDDAYVEAGMIYRRYIAGRDTLVDNIQASDLSAGVKTELGDLFHNGYAVLDRVLNTAPDIPDNLGDQKILTDALISFSDLDIIFNRVNKALETKKEEPPESPLEENDVKGINNRIAFEASRVAVLRDKYVNEPSLATEMEDVIIPKEYRTLPDWKERRLQNGWSQLECQAKDIVGGRLKVIFFVSFRIHDEGVLVERILDMRPDGERGVNTELILRGAIEDVAKALSLEGPINRVFVIGGMSYSWKDLKEYGFLRVPTDDEGIAKLDPKLQKFLKAPDVSGNAFWYYPAPGASEMPMPVVTPSSPNTSTSFFDYTRSYNKANYPEESFRFLAYSIGILGGDRIQEMDQAFYEFGRLNASNIITVEEMEALREGYIALKDKIQEIRGIRPFIDPERGPDYEAEAKAMVEGAISGREVCLAATDAFILRLGSDARLAVAYEVISLFRARTAEYFDELAARYAALATATPAAIQTAAQAPPIAPEAAIMPASAASAAVVSGNAERPWQAGPLEAQEMDRARRIVTIAASFSHGTNEDTELMAPFGGAMVYCELLLPGLNVNDPDQAELAASMENFIGKADKLFAAHNDAIAMISPEESERARDIESMIYEDRGNIEAWFNAIEEAYKALIENADIVGAILPKLENRISAEDYEMLGNILKYSLTAEEILSDRIKAVKGELSDEPVDMNEIMRDLPYNLICTSHGDFGMERFRFEASAPDSPLFVRGNRRSLISMVSNLAANAFKYAGKNARTGADAVITLGIRNDNGRVIITVSDDGVGMEPEFAKRVLGDEFVTTAGTGIGTKEAKIVATNHGGSIDVSSELGKGTTFTVDLPEFTAPAESSTNTLLFTADIPPVEEENHRPSIETLDFIEESGIFPELRKDAISDFSLELISNMAMHSSGGTLKIYGEKDITGKIEKVIFVAQDNGDGLSESPNDLLRKSMEVHKNATGRNFGFKYITLDPDSVTIETRGKRWDRVTKDENAAEWFKESGVSPISKGSKFTLEFELKQAEAGTGLGLPREPSPMLPMPTEPAVSAPPAPVTTASADDTFNPGDTAEIDLYGKDIAGLAEEFITAIDNGKPIVLSLSRMFENRNIDPETRRLRYEEFDERIYLLGKELKKYGWDGMAYSMAELSNNAFVHGNHLDTGKPIVIHVKLKADKTVERLDVYDAGLEGGIDPALLKAADDANITGGKVGIMYAVKFGKVEELNRNITDMTGHGLRTRATIVPIESPAALPVAGGRAGLISPREPSPILVEAQVPAAKVVISELPQGTTDIVVMPGSETYKSQQFALGKEIDRKLRKDYGQYTVPINYVFAADIAGRQAGIEQAVKQALNELIGKIKDGDKTARVMTYILPEDEQFMKDLLDGADFAEYKSRFTVVKEENIPQSGLIDEVMHIILAKGLLNYQRYENDEYGQGTRLSDQAKRQLADFIKTLIANPEAIDFDQDPGIINKILNGSINLRIRPIDFKEAQAWKKMQDAVLKSL